MNTPQLVGALLDDSQKYLSLAGSESLDPERYIETLFAASDRVGALRGFFFIEHPNFSQERDGTAMLVSLKEALEGCGRPINNGVIASLQTLFHSGLPERGLASRTERGNGTNHERKLDFLALVVMAAIHIVTESSSPSQNHATEASHSTAETPA